MTLAEPTRVLDGRNVVITGAGKGLGASYARQAAAAGARVVVNDVDTAAADATVSSINEAGGSAISDGSDISTIEGATKLIDACVGTFGGLDALINNAAVMYEAQLWEADLTRFQRVIDVNVLGSIYCTAAAVKVMAQSGGGAILNAGSLAANGYPRNDVYAASKGAVTSFSYSTALEVEALGIRVNTIWPSALTPMVTAMIATSTRPETVNQEQRMAHPDAVAPLAIYLISPQSVGITGQTFHFDGKTLGVVVQTPLAVTPHVERADGWTLEAVTEAVNDGALSAALQPYGPRGASLPPRCRGVNAPVEPKDAPSESKEASPESVLAASTARITRSGMRRSEKVSENLARQIVSDMRDLPVGSALPAEAAMLERYDVGRPSLREALRLLEFNGLIVMRPGPGGGPRVAEVDSTHYARITSLYLHRSSTTYEEVDEVRMLIEPRMARLAALSGDEAGGQELKRLVAAGHQTRNRVEHIANSEEFHAVIFDMSGNKALTLLALAYHEVYASMLSETSVPLDRRAHVHDAHGAIADAIIAGDAERSETLMRMHMYEYAQLTRRMSAEALGLVVSWH